MTFSRLIMSVFIIRQLQTLDFFCINKSINEFNMMLAASASDQGFVLSTLETDAWLKPENWQTNNLREKLDAVSGDFKIGRFLDKILIDGISGYKDLEIQSDISELLLPAVDNWYPLDRLLRNENFFKFKAEN